MPNVKCWPGAICQITAVPKIKGFQHLLGQVVKVTRLGGDHPNFGPFWELDQTLQVKVEVPILVLTTGVLYGPGQPVPIASFPDCFLTPFKPLDEPADEITSSQLDIKRPAPQEPSHA